ncbi:MAG: NAD(P)H-binding protein [Flavobacteriaceae bacterium]|jgi:nucleoside-diphosphate-sugar epimerase|nr:NAD(P)H-binding protein [Flavobacteriaceae bacterium]
MKKIAIMGCGWLGKALAQSLIAKGYHVRGSVTTENHLEGLRNLGIEPFLIKLNNEAITGNLTAFLKEVDTLVIAFPPGLRKNPKANYANRIKILVTALTEHSSCKLVMLGSIGVFGSSQGVVNEKSTPKPDNLSGQQLLEAEKSILTAINHATIVRLGGLVGGDRHPAKQLAGRINIPAPLALTNLVHREDVVRFLMAIIEGGHWGKTLHCVSPVHQRRVDFYTLAAKRLNLPLPAFATTGSTRNKVVMDDSSAGLFDFTYRLADCGVEVT